MIRNVARRLPPVTEATTGAQAYRRFEQEPDTLAIAVVGPDGRPVGLIERNAFFLKMGSAYGRALFGGRSISHLMDASPIVAEADMALGSFLAGAVQNGVAGLLRGICGGGGGPPFPASGQRSTCSLARSTRTSCNAADMTELAEQRLQANLEAEAALTAPGAARDAAEAANRAKTEFLANMSHEIRTPLNGVIGIASALSRTELTGRQQEMVQLIETSADSLQVLLSDVLDMARVEAGRMEIAPEPFDLAEAAMGVAGLFRPKAEEKGLALNVFVGRELAPRLLGDAVRIKQILGNLLSNAVKFTQRGEVRLLIDAHPAVDGAQVLALCVEDTGIGFDADTARRLFGRFAQADGSISRRFGGTGLGLSISNSLAELMGGRIAAASTSGEGSRFTLTLSLPVVAIGDETKEEACETDALLPPSNDGERPLRILVAEDHDVNRQSRAVDLRGGLDVDLIMAVNGAEALACYAASAFDLVLMDMQMPVMDGLEAIVAIRRREAEARLPRTPIIMLTANALLEHEAAGRAAGAPTHSSPSRSSPPTCSFPPPRRRSAMERTRHGGLAPALTLGRANESWCRRTGLNSLSTSALPRMRSTTELRRRGPSGPKEAGS